MRIEELRAVACYYLSRKELLGDENYRSARDSDLSLDLDDKQIPRRMLFNANLELLERGLNPIIDLKDKEIEESEKLLGTDGKEILD